MDLQFLVNQELQAEKAAALAQSKILAWFRSTDLEGSRERVLPYKVHNFQVKRANIVLTWLLSIIVLRGAPNASPPPECMLNSGFFIESLSLFPRKRPSANQWLVTINTKFNNWLQVKIRRSSRQSPSGLCNTHTARLWPEFKLHLLSLFYSPNCLRLNSDK